MDLHVVEVQIAHTYSRPDGILRDAPEWKTFREARMYDAVGGDVSFAQVTFAESELHQDPVDDVALLGGRIAGAVAEGAAAGRKILMIGGNCANVPGVIGGLQDVHGPTARIGLIWIDAHGDFNTPRTTPGGILGGMPVATIAGLCLPKWRSGAHVQVPMPTDRIVMVDVRALLATEAEIVRASDITVVPIDGPGLGEAAERLAREVDVLYVHVDLDILDPSLIPSHMAHAGNGPGIEETVAALGTCFDTRAVDVFALVSYYATRPGGDVSVQAAADILSPSLEHWARVSDPAGVVTAGS
jgi:arginase